MVDSTMRYSMMANASIGSHFAVLLAAYVFLSKLLGLASATLVYLLSLR